MTCAALVTAGGQGARMGRDIPKQYLDLRGIPILARTLMVFETHPMIDTIVVTVPPGDEEYCQGHVISRYGIRKVREIVPGGDSRQQSVHNGLKTIVETEIVAIHDGVRPFVTADTISRTIEAARATGASAACVRVRDTVKKQEGEFLHTISRSNLWLAHTPQAFRTLVILDAHRRAQEDRFVGTDDASLVERLGIPVSIVEDAYTNLKITTPDDLNLADILLRRALSP
ncbi:MAG: 2-C-methyl-D-erythritol 4-phosphate cytidylyltransferase [Desulfomonilaceae bacterium]|nr:2-C-methyl-D-erythritol 4-phosphate cytidylyltransferase [Desulfomonilaceae bacterium]